ncbi:acyl-CoA dehydrogenase family protein [Spongisporangium articulatum]|uniref:Acyl-CoA dehydrogenase family protein n=1 Tax=Spongisporangium articulatum TaxID=3362603 RepID=A0ABW8ATQ0_9ACTN
MNDASTDDFRQEIRTWLAENLTGRFAGARGLGGPGREHEAFELRRDWDRNLAAAGWTCVGWPVEHGGRGATPAELVVFHEEYARADAPVRLGHIGEELLGPTLIAYGSPEQQARHLPGIRAAEHLWCQGYSEPGAGSDLANVATRAERDGDEWVITGQKVWTSLAHVAGWAFVLCRTEPGSTRHHGLSYLLVPMDQPGVEVRPIVQLTGTSEFNEVFFDGARARADDVVGEVGGGWAVALGTLAFERGAATLGQQVGFRRELERVVATAARTGALDDPVLADRLARAWAELEVMRAHALRTGGGAHGAGQANVTKLLWARWHRTLGELAVAVQTDGGLVAAGPPYDLTDAQRLYLFSRADTLYGGSDEVQRTVLAERVLGLPREPKGAQA